MEAPRGSGAPKAGLDGSRSSLGLSLAPLRAGMAAQFAVGGAVIPFITLLFRERGLTFAQTSLIFTASSATLLAFPFLWGYLADRWLPLNRLFLLLNLLGCAALAWLSAARDFPSMLLAYTGYFACFNPTLYLMNALCFHHLPNPREQFGKLRAWGSLGWIVPFLPIALWLARHEQRGFGFVLWLGMACCLVMAALSFWLPHTPPGARSVRGAAAGDVTASAAASHAYGLAARRLLTNGNYVVLLFSMFLMAGSFSLLTYYSPPMLQEAGVPRPWIGPIQAIGVIFEIVLFQVQPAVIRRWNYAIVILGGCAALVLRHILFATVMDAWTLSASYLLAGATIVFYNQGVSILANAMAAREVRATAQTWLLFFGQGMGPLCANVLAGMLAARTSDRLAPVFWLAAGLAALAAGVIAMRGSRLNAGAK
jgi:MFS family permease